jgi:hypothetical protein
LADFFIVIAPGLARMRQIMGIDLEYKITAPWTYLVVGGAVATWCRLLISAPITSIHWLKRCLKTEFIPGELSAFAKRATGRRHGMFCRRWLLAGGSGRKRRQCSTLSGGTWRCFALQAGSDASGRLKAGTKWQGFAGARAVGWQAYTGQQRQAGGITSNAKA